MTKPSTLAQYPVYALSVAGYRGDTPEFRFSFHAKDSEQAQNRGFEWGRYHDYDVNTVTVRLAEGEELLIIRDEYMVRWR